MNISIFSLQINEMAQTKISDDDKMCTGYISPEIARRERTMEEIDLELFT